LIPVKHIMSCLFLQHFSNRHPRVSPRQYFSEPRHRITNSNLYPILYLKKTIFLSSFEALKQSVTTDSKFHNDTYSHHATCKFNFQLNNTNSTPPTRSREILSESSSIDQQYLYTIGELAIVFQSFPMNISEWWYQTDHFIESRICKLQWFKRHHNRYPGDILITRQLTS